MGTAIRENNNEIDKINDKIKSLTIFENNNQRIDLSVVSKQLELAEQRKEQEWNMRVWGEKKENQEVVQGEYNHLTISIDDCDEKKDALIKKTKFPVDGMSYDGDRITMNGHPLTSDGQTRVAAFKLARILAGDLPIATMENFSLLDEENQEGVIKDAEDAGFQLFVELVQIGKKNSNEFLLVDGEIE